MDGVHIDVRGCGRGGFMNLTYTKELFTLAEKLWNTMESIHVSLRTSEDFKSVLAEIEQLHRLMGGAPSNVIYEMRHIVVWHAISRFERLYLPHVRDGIVPDEFGMEIVARSTELFSFLTPEFLSRDNRYLQVCRENFRATASAVISRISMESPGYFHWYNIARELDALLPKAKGF